MTNSTQRWFLSSEAIAVGAQFAPLSQDELNHATRVLRLRSGDLITIFDGNGVLAEAVLPDLATQPNSKKSAAGIRVALRGVRRIEPSTRSLTLIVAACKGPRLEWLVEKSTELGVSELCFTRFARSVAAPGPGSFGKLTRIAIEACKQSHRAWLPKIGESSALADAITAFGDGGALLVAHPEKSAPFMVSAIRASAATKRLAIVVGPEGGLTEEEVALAQARGGRVVQLAAYTLRVETAALACAAAWAAHGE